ncbi:MAG: thiol:disulfide interchange protein DsbA/DsbL [Halothiobacillaceae bacterium]
MRLIHALLGSLAGVVLAAAPVFAAERYHEIADPKPAEAETPIVVEEFFWFGCPSCYQFEPHLEAWLADLPEDVTFVRVAPALNPGWEPLARAHYAAEMLEVGDEIHGALFEAIHARGFRPESAEQLADFYAGQGVDREQFLQMYNSFAVMTSVRRANSRAQQLGIRGVPSMVVNGTYRVDVKEAGGHAGMIDVTEQLIETLREGD